MLRREHLFQFPAQFILDPQQLPVLLGGEVELCHGPRREEMQTPLPALTALGGFLNAATRTAHALPLHTRAPHPTPSAAEAPTHHPASGTAGPRPHLVLRSRPAGHPGATETTPATAKTTPAATTAEAGTSGATVLQVPTAGGKTSGVWSVLLRGLRRTSATQSAGAARASSLGRTSLSVGSRVIVLRRQEAGRGPQRQREDYVCRFHISFSFFVFSAPAALACRAGIRFEVSVELIFCAQFSALDIKRA